VSPSQTQLYLRTWGAAWKANWFTHKGSVQALRPELGQWAETVEAAAEAIARRQHRAVKQDDIRHAVHLVALGKDKSSKDLTNREFDRVLCLLRLLTDPDDLEAVIKWEHPELDERKRLLWTIHRSPEAYVRDLCMDRFRTSDLDSLSDAQIKMLAMTLRNRPPRTTGKPAPVSC
jgi:hypothetical protein